MMIPELKLFAVTKSASGADSATINPTARSWLIRTPRLAIRTAISRISRQRYGTDTMVREICDANGLEDGAVLGAASASYHAMPRPEV